MTEQTPQPDDLHEDLIEVQAARLVDSLATERVEALLIGGAAVRLLCERARVPPLRRTIRDVDFVARAGQQSRLASVFGGLGYVEDRETNLLQGDRRLIFYERDSGLKVDVFVGAFAMCHAVDVTAGRPGIADVTSLVLTKLQVVQLTSKDVSDLLALFGDHELGSGPGAVDVQRVVDASRGDWGLYTTITDGMREVAARAAATPGCEPAAARIEDLLATVEAAEKSRSWRMRARIGRRKRWYEVPEEIEEVESLSGDLHADEGMR